MKSCRCEIPASPGVRVDSAGDTVAAGDVMVVLEAMKHTITAPHAGIVSALHVGAGQKLESGALIAVIEEGTP